MVRGLEINALANTMFMPDVTFSPSLRIVAGGVDKLGVDIRSFREPLKRSIQQVMAPSFRQNFEAGGRPESWAPLSDATYELDEKLNRPRRGILISTGLLMRTTQQLNIWTLTRTSALIAGLPDKIWYGKIHQAGNATTPARPFVIMQSEDMDDIERVFDEWLGERIQATILRSWRYGRIV